MVSKEEECELNVIIEHKEGQIFSLLGQIFTHFQHLAIREEAGSGNGEGILE
jgi:hypothetical protein